MNPSGSNLPADCRRFLDELPESLGGSAMPEHSSACPGCAKRWLAARRLAVLLRLRPPVPAALHGQAAFDGVWERVVDQAENAPVGRLLQAALVPRAMPAAESVPATELARRLLGGVVPAPAQLWPRVRHEVDQQVARDRRVRLARRIGVLTLASAAALLFCLRAIDSQETEGRVGTQVQVAIVFEDMTTSPDVAIMPVSVLRSSLR